jgi:transcriptional antiterminator RfaH
MPILAAEPDCYPANLLDLPELHAGSGRVWWVLYTRPRHEKQLMRRLRGLAVRFYTPLIAHPNRSPCGRVRNVYLPLFAGYVFLYGDETDRYRALTTNCVSRWLVVPDQRELTRDLRQVRRLIESGAPLLPEQRMGPGTPVAIASGPLAGLEGTIVRQGQRSKFVVQVHFLQRGASVEVEAWMIKPLGEAPSTAAVRRVG